MIRGLHPVVVDTLASAAKELGYPTRGEFAKSLYILAGNLCSTDRARLYAECGYQGRGYPLQRSLQLDKQYSRLGKVA